MGGYFFRLVIFYQLFEEKEFALRAFISSQNLPGILMILRAAVALTLILFPLFILFFISFLFSSKLNLKQNGWLFIITMIILITLPFEIYLMTIDYNIVVKINYNSFDTNEVLNLVIKRFKALSSFPLVELMSYFAVIYLMIFQPLKMKTADNP